MEKQAYSYEGFTLKQWRERFDITQIDLCNVINKGTGGNLSEVTVSYWENGKFQPSNIYKSQIARAIEHFKGLKKESEAVN